MTGEERAHAYLDRVIAAIQRNARRRGSTAESDWNGFVSSLSESEDLRRALQGIYLDARDSKNSEPTL